MHRFNELILNIPYLFLMKVPYLWLPAVVFFEWPPWVSLVLCGVILLALLAMDWQNTAWIEKVRREFATDPTSIQVVIERPTVRFILRGVLILAGLSLVTGWLTHGFLGLSGLQWGFFAGGFLALYRKALLFGSRTTYIFTDQGLGIRFVPGHIDYRILIRYNEIRSARVTVQPGKIPERWTVIAPTAKINQGLLLTARNIKGFSPSIDQILLGSKDPGELARKFPTTLRQV